MEEIEKLKRQRKSLISNFGFYAVNTAKKEFMNYDYRFGTEEDPDKLKIFDSVLEKIKNGTELGTVPFYIYDTLSGARNTAMIPFDEWDEIFKVKSE